MMELIKVDEQVATGGDLIVVVVCYCCVLKVKTQTKQTKTKTKTNKTNGKAPGQHGISEDKSKSLTMIQQ
jgi:hypothetical protein